MSDSIRNAEQFGSLIRDRRRAAGINQDELAARCGVARRFIIDLEAGKPTCQIGKAITAAVELGIKLGDIATIDLRADAHSEPEAEALEEDDDLAHVPKF